MSALVSSKCKTTEYTVTCYFVKFCLHLQVKWSDVTWVCGWKFSEKYGVQTTNYWIILSHCIPIFWEFYVKPCLPGFLRKWQSELRPKSAQKLKKKKSGLIAGALDKNHLEKQNISGKNIKK